MIIMVNTMLFKIAVDRALVVLLLFPLIYYPLLKFYPLLRRDGTDSSTIFFLTVHTRMNLTEKADCIMNNFTRLLMSVDIFMHNLSRFQ